MEVSALSSIIPPLPSTPPSRLFLSKPSTLKPPPRQHSPLDQLHNLHPFPSFKAHALSLSHCFEDEPDEEYDESLPLLSIGTEDEPDETVGVLRPDVSEDGWLAGNHNGCKACGREEIERGCNGEGRVQGGIATFPGLGWWPIKAYRPCPGLVASGGSYKRQGQSMDEVVSGVAKGVKSIRTTGTGSSRLLFSLWGV
ncbi:hypothetical protein AKJ16_DCAP09634 [Drosera capensis]